MSVNFDDSDLLTWLEQADNAALEQLDFGMIAMTDDGKVVGYNSVEAELSGLTPARVIGRNFFTAVAPCTNNYLVANRFAMEPELDATIDYVFTLRMKPTPVRLRMLRANGAQRMYLAVMRRWTD